MSFGVLRRAKRPLICRNLYLPQSGIAEWGSRNPTIPEVGTYGSRGPPFLVGGSCRASFGVLRRAKAPLHLDHRFFVHTDRVTDSLLPRIEALIRAHRLIEPGGSVTCLVSGGADST